MSENKRKCIGVFISKPYGEYQTDVLRGIYKAAFEHDMNVAVFCSVSKSRELDLFSLPDYDNLSGIIYVPYTFDFEDADKIITPRLLKEAEEKDFPVVVFDRETEGLSSVMCDDSETMRIITEHLITEHNCRDIAFLTGNKGHMHAENRLKIFKKVMAEHDLPILPDRTEYGAFWYNDGEAYAEKLMHSEYGMPEAIICANNFMACGVYRALRKHGIRTPEDVILAQYSDETDSCPFITGAIKQVEPAGYAACNLLVEMTENRKLRKQLTVKCGCKLLKSLTCGCTNISGYDLSEKTTARSSYFYEFNLIVADLLGRKNYKELFYGIDWYTCYIEDAKGIYFCMKEDWDDPVPIPDRDNNSGFTERIRLYYYRLNFDDGTHKSVYENNEYFSSKEMFPALFRSEGKPSSFVFRPLFFGESCFGYVVIDNGQRMKTYDVSYDFWLKDISNVIEAQRRFQNMNYLYSSDLMTGVYNRNGFNNMMPEMIDRAKKQKKILFTAVCDLNGMKFINDTFGHVEGDSSIKTAAEMISECRVNGSEEEKTFRIGGDEFVKAAIGDFSEEDIKSFKRGIEKRIKQFNSTSGKAYPIYISVGVCVKNPDEDYSLDIVIYEADKEMFRDKARIREATGFNPKRK